MGRGNKIESDKSLSNKLENLPSNTYIGKTFEFSNKCKDIWVAIDSRGWVLDKANTLKELLNKITRD